MDKILNCFWPRLCYINFNIKLLQKFFDRFFETKESDIIWTKQISQFLELR